MHCCMVLALHYIFDLLYHWKLTLGGALCLSKTTWGVLVLHG